MMGPRTAGRAAGDTVHDTIDDALATSPIDMTWRPHAAHRSDEESALAKPEQTILSFDVEEHHRIEAAVGMQVDADRKAEYTERMETATRWLLDVLGERNLKATFFIVGKIAERKPDLVRAIHAAGHEIASHSWDHKRVHNFTPDTFREDVRRGKSVLEQLTGTAVVGFRAPTFSIVRETCWALDVLVEEGFHYDSSIYPVRHDRYGVPRAPRVPFLARGQKQALLELPPATLRWLWTNVPVGGGGYFRLLPLFFMKRGLRQLHRRGKPSVAMIYFHPWEFDADQPRLPLTRMGRFRTYVGLKQSRDRLLQLINGSHFVRAVDVARRLNGRRHLLEEFSIGQ
jgi:polysaccharide deacetylase family protein (PEP-CTERM system associated)